MDESALKIALDCLYKSLSSLHGWFDVWTAVVILGVMFELIVVVTEYREDLHDFNKGTIHPPIKPTLWLFVLGFFGAALVAIGVSGELAIDIKVGRIENQIRLDDQQRYLILSKEAGDAKQSAKGASLEALSAKDRAATAAVDASVAQREVNKAALILFADSTGQVVRISLLNPPTAFRENVSVTWRRGVSPETIQFAEQLSRAMSSLGWHVSKRVGQSDKAPSDWGVTIWNKWVLFQRPHPELRGRGGYSALKLDDTSGYLQAVWDDGSHPGMNKEHSDVLATVAIALDAKLNQDPTMPDDLLEIVVNNVNDPK